MKRNLIEILGWFGFSVAAMYFIWNMQGGGLTNPDYKRNTRDIAIISVALVVGGKLLSRGTRKMGVGMGRCRTCGKLIPKNEVFCYDHGLKQIWDAQDSSRDKFGKR